MPSSQTDRINIVVTNGKSYEVLQCRDGENPDYLAAEKFPLTSGWTIAGGCDSSEEADHIERDRALRKPDSH
jgi:hypothetical protein